MNQPPPPTPTSVPPEPSALRVSIAIPASLTEADKAWALEHPEQVNANLQQWYGHRRQCRRAAQRRGDSLESGVSACRCFA